MIEACKRPPQRVLFIGNSLTAYNWLPGQIATMGIARNRNVSCDMHTPDGHMLSQHVSDPTTQRKIREGNWDVVVLQEKSEPPALSREEVERDVYPYAAALCQLIKEANPQVQIVFYATMAWKDGVTYKAHLMPEIATYQGMQARVNATYNEMARSNGGLIAPVGEAWQMIRENYPGIELYVSDPFLGNVHPNQMGTYLAACVFNSVFFNESPIGLPPSSFVDVQTAKHLQEMACRATFGAVGQNQ